MVTPAALLRRHGSSQRRGELGRAVMVRVLACPGRQESILRLLPRRHDHVPPCLGAVFHRRATPQGVPWQRYGPPHRPWVTPRARNLATTLEDQGRSLRLLVRDRDDEFVGPFDEVLRSTGTRCQHTRSSPQANAFAEGFVCTARAECLDWPFIRRAASACSGSGRATTAWRTLARAIGRTA